MDTNFINPVVTSVLNVLSMMARVSPEPGSPVQKDPYDIVEGRNITGLISMVGQNATASAALTFTEPAILHIAKQMMPGAEVGSINGMVIDLVGELANMALGGAKSELEAKGFVFKLSLPTVIVGSDYIVSHRAKAPIVMLPFTMPEGAFFVEASYEVTGPILDALKRK